MRMTTFLSLATCLHLCAATSAQKINLNEKHSSLSKVFQKISDQTGMLFIYRDEWLSQTRDVTISVKTASLKEVLDICFANQPFTYEIIQKMVVLKERPVPLPLPPAADTSRRPAAAFRGQVTDSIGNPLVGATVRIRGTKRGANTDIKGMFELYSTQPGDVVVISYTGYTTKEAAVSRNAFADVILQHSQDILDATVVQAYGTTSRRFNVGSISTVDAATIEKQPVTNVLLALQGQVPGLAVNATSGVPGSRVQLQVRGQNTLNSDRSNAKPYDQPLFIIDGIPFAPQNNNINQLNSLATASSFSGGISQAGGLSPFNSINPADIESVSILKDADATSIYGTQGSNGVVLITTKKGKAGKTVFSLNANTGFNTTARRLKLMNTQQYLQMRKDAFAADGVAPGNDPYSDGYAPDLTIFDSTKYTDWEKLIFGKSSGNTDIHANLSGGTYNNTFMVSLGYGRSNYNFPGAGFADQRMSMHTTLHHTSTDNRLAMDVTTDYSYDQNNSPGFGGASKVLLAPNTPDLLDSAGNLLWNYKGVDLNSQYQFYSYLKTPALAQVYNLNTGLHITYKILTGLSFGAVVGYSRNSTNGHSEIPSTAQDPQYINRSANFTTNTLQTVNVEPQIDYTYTSGKSMLTALAGATYKKNLGQSTSTSGSKYASDEFLGSINGAGSIYSSDVYSIYRYSAAFARLKYIYDQKYILSLTGRRDGSSNFGPGRQFGNFGSVGAGWIFSEEKGFRTVLPVISFAKAAGSYGTSGSDGIAAYMYQAFWKPNTNAPAFEDVRPNIPVNLYNPNYSWALKKSLNVSLELGFFHDRVFLRTEYYRDRTGNQLANYPLPIQTGFNSVLANMIATIQNKGWEFTVTSTNIKAKDFSWTTNFNISLNRNKLLSFPNLESSPYNDQYIIGKPTSEVYGYPFAGLNPTTGLFEYKSSKGGVTTNPNYQHAALGGDQVPIGNMEIKYMGGFGNNFSYKQFSLYVFFQFSSQLSPNYLAEIYEAYSAGGQIGNLPVQALDYWKKPGDHTPLQMLTAGYNYDAANAASAFYQSSGAYSDDTYLRLKTLTVSYAFPQAIMKRMHMQGGSINLSAQNLLTFTDWKVTDPEQFNDFTVFPLQRIVAIGLNLNF